MLSLILLIAAFLLFLGAAFSFAAPRVQLGWLGAAVLTLSLILQSGAL